MRRSLLIVWLSLITFALAACGGGNDSSNAADGDPINGIWKDGERSLVIDGTVGYYDSGSGYVYGCDVNLNKQTITMNDYSWDDTNPEYSYEFISDKLVLETKNSQALDSTFTFELSDQKVIDSSDISLEGDWYVSDKLLTLDGEKGLLENDLSSYKCGIDTGNKTITINKYSWNNSDPAYKYQLINGKLLLWSDNKEAYDKSLLFYTKEEFDALPKDDSSDEEDIEEESEGDSGSTSTEVDPDFKATMDSYEAFFDEYVEFMKKYEKSDDTSGMMADYADYMMKYSDFMAKMDEIDEDSLSSADLLYYNEVNARILKKLSEVM